MELRKDIGIYDLKEKIGHGNFGTVFLGVSKETSKKVAIKRIPRFDTEEEEKAIQQEIRIIIQLKHPNIVQFEDLIVTDDYYYIVFEYCKHGDLDEFIAKKFPDTKYLPEHQAHKLAQQIFTGIRAMSNRRIVHRDLKLANILVGDDYVVKLADFGWSRYTEGDRLMLKTFAGTPITAAPEVLLQKHYNEKCDIWSLGIILYKILVGKFPFNATQSMGSLIKQIMENQEIEFPENLSESVKSLIRSMLTIDVNDRIGFTELFQHPWVTGTSLNPSLVFEDTHQTIVLKTAPNWFPDTSEEFRERFYAKINKNEKFNDYTIKKLLGSGMSYNIYLATENIKNQKVVIKIIGRYNRVEDEMIDREIEAVRLLNHPNIIKLLCTHKNDEAYYLVYEYCENLDLQTFIKKNYPKNRIPEYQAMKLAHQIFAGVHAMREKNIVHRDLKPSNILVCADYTIKIAGFDSARVLNSQEESLNVFRGTPLIVAPEMIEQKNYDARCDIWSLGVCLYMILIGNYPFYPRSFSLQELLLEIKTTVPVFPDYISKLGKNLLSSMLCVDPKARIKFKDLFTHPWISGGVIGFNPNKLVAWYPETHQMYVEMVYLQKKIATEKAAVRTLESNGTSPMDSNLNHSQLKVPLDRKYSDNEANLNQSVSLNKHDSTPAPLEKRNSKSDRLLNWIGPNIGNQETQTNLKKDKRVSDSNTDIYKIVLVGETGVGKSILLNSFLIEKPFTDAEPKYQMGVYSKQKVVSINDVTVELNLHAVAGEHRQSSEGPKFCRKAVGALLVFDLTNRESFNQCGSWLNLLRDYADPNAVIILVGNKVNKCLEDKKAREIGEDEARQFAQENSLLYFETCGWLFYNVWETFERLVQDIQMVWEAKGTKVMNIYNNDYRQGSELSKTLTTAKSSFEDKKLEKPKKECQIF